MKAAKKPWKNSVCLAFMIWLLSLTTNLTAQTTPNQRDSKLFVDQTQYEELQQRKHELEEMIKEIKALQDTQRELITRESDIRQLISEIEEKGNDFATDVDQHSNKILNQGLRLDRVSEDNKKNRRRLRKESKGKKKVVRQGKEMSKVDRKLRIADGVAKLILSVSP